MDRVKWFDRSFDFQFGMEEYSPLLERLQKAPGLYGQAVSGQPDQRVELKPSGKWSVKENIGHMLILEPLWRKRFQEIASGLAEMSPADLSNTATEDARFNEVPLGELLEQFADSRKATTDLLKGFNQNELSLTSIHPRLQKPMRIVDLMHFVAEHDDHHLMTIKNLLAQ